MQALIRSTCLYLGLFLINTWTGKERKAEVVRAERVWEAGNHKAGPRRERETAEHCKGGACPPPLQEKGLGPQENWPHRRLS